ncbi:MAG: tRNA (guanosine(37)-N1)-methyltransferase TrmD [Anaerolineae bacterium]|nr:tRNA (guanosine(37)-N1)-methyltransferase TrmD [Anaerolineae bacterium]
MHIDIFTLFPAMFDGPLTESILKRAQENGLLTLARHDIRAYTTDKHHTTDDTPYGGGGGMIMKVEPITAAIEATLGADLGRMPVILLSPQGRVLTQAVAQELAAHDRIALLCGHYEGVDERVRQLLITDEISIGDYVLTGGELPAMVLIDVMARLLPGVLGDEHAAANDSHATGLLEGPHYTRPESFRGLDVPGVLAGGDHARVARWRREQAIKRTWQRRPELLLTAELSEREKWLLTTLAEADAPPPA